MNAPQFLAPIFQPDSHGRPAQHLEPMPTPHARHRYYPSPDARPRGQKTARDRRNAVRELIWDAMHDADHAGSRAGDFFNRLLDSFDDLESYEEEEAEEE